MGPRALHDSSHRINSTFTTVDDGVNSSKWPPLADNLRFLFLLSAEWGPAYCMTPVFV